MIGGDVFKIVVAEDEELILNNVVKKIYKADLSFEVVGTAQDGKTALELVDKLLPHVLITDIRMPVMDGIELIENVNHRYPNIKKVVISGYDEFEYARMALKLEVKDYLLKPLKLSDLIQCLNKIRISLETEKQKLSISSEHDYSPQEIAHMVEHYIRENYNRDINFDDIAEHFNFSPAYLSRIFTKHIGEPPSKYMLNLRINQARQLLASSPNLSVKEIGEIVGYPEQSYFSRIFKNITGKSPSEYRDDLLAESSAQRKER